jgi:hypothetical protein
MTGLLHRRNKKAGELTELNPIAETPFNAFQ